MKQNYDFLASLVAVGTTSMVMSQCVPARTVNETDSGLRGAVAAGSTSVPIRIPAEAIGQEMAAEQTGLLDVFAFRGDAQEKAEDAWLSTVGMFAGDTDMSEILEEARMVRDRHRLA